MAWHQVKCDNKQCNNGYLMCEHNARNAHVVSEAQAKNKRDIGRTCQPPHCSVCVGTGHVMRQRG